MFAKRKNKIDFIESVTRRVSVVPLNDSKQGLDFLVSFFQAIRPSKGKLSAAKNMEQMISALREHPILLQNFQHALISQLVRTDLSAALTESGIPLARGFWQEFFGRVKHKLLPSFQNDRDFLFVLNRIFFRSTDYKWVENIPLEMWVRFFQNFGISFGLNDNRIIEQLIQALKILAFQIAQTGLEKEIAEYISPETKKNNPFVNQNYLIHDLEELLETSGFAAEINTLSTQIAESIDECYNAINFIRENHTTRGASLHQTYTLVILQNRLDRLSILVDVIGRDSHFDTVKFVAFFKLLVRNENRKNSLLEFLSQCLGYLAYQIAEHKGSKGTKYITANRKEFNGMLRSAMGGGAIISFIAVFKNLLSKIDMPLFWHGFTYSVNYSIGFVVIEETHATLATKQPAFTASAVASSLDTKKIAGQPNLYNLAITTAKVVRSQIASFAGNLVTVFPVTFLLAWAYEYFTGSKIVEGKAAVDMLRDLHPAQSLSLLYACNTGVFLFLSGIIAGYVQNKIQYAHIAERLTTHPILRLSLSEKRINNLANYVEKHAGALIGNIALGFFLGMSGLIAKFFGIPFDIRHITIAAGNVAVAAYGIGLHNINPWYLLQVIAGVLGIGFFNFLISFCLAFIVAVKSRGVRLKNYPEFLGILWRYFKNNPLDFIRPRKRIAVE